MWALERTKHFVQHNPRLVLYTDHKPLISFANENNQQQLPEADEGPTGQPGWLVDVAAEAACVPQHDLHRQQR